MSGQPPDVKQLLDASFTYLRVSERLRSFLPILSTLADELRELDEVEPDLAPELNAIRGHMGETLDAIRRAHLFADARFRVAIGDDDEA